MSYCHVESIEILICHCLPKKLFPQLTLIRKKNHDKKSNTVIYIVIINALSSHHRYIFLCLPLFEVSNLKQAPYHFFLLLQYIGSWQLIKL